MINLSILSLLITACTIGDPAKKELEKDSLIAKSAIQLSEDQGLYWYGGEAEITSYKLSQARYGELREGKAVMVFVTEPFSTSSWTKADNPNSKDVPVLKLNFTKNFNTGIYPYSMMTSTFIPFEQPIHSLKISSSSQEWCGHTFMELRNKAQFEVNINSYFEGESTDINLEKAALEDDIWSRIKLDPNGIQEGELEMIPSFFYLRLRHKETKAYACQISKVSKAGIVELKLEYPELQRTLLITYNEEFPYQINGWTETYASGFGRDAKQLSTTATRIETLKTAYWNKNSNADAVLRERLGL